MPDLSPAAWIAAQNVFSQAFGLAVFAIQAPLLGPRAFGLMTLVMVFIGFCEFALEISSTDALISVRQIDGKHYSTMTTANALLSSVLGITAFLCAHRIALIFKEPELEGMLHWMSVLPVISALATAPNAASRRDLQFRPLAIRIIISVIAGGVTGLTLAFLHYGVWALVWQAIVQRIVNVGVLWRIVAIRFRLGFSWPHFLELWRYGGPMLLSQTMSWGSTQIPRFVLGLYLTATDLGLFTLATRMSEVVAMVALSPAFGVARVRFRALVDDPAALRAAVQGHLRHTALLCFPLCVGGAAAMPILFKAWLDARWTGGVLAAQLMLLGVMPYVVHYGLSAALLAMNRQPLIAVNSIVQSITTVLAAAVFAPFGLNAATGAIAARPLITALIPMAYARRECDISFGSVIRAQLWLFIAALAMGVLVAGFDMALAPHVKPLPLLGAAVLLGVASYVVLIRWLVPDLAAEYLQKLRGRHHP